MGKIAWRFIARRCPDPLPADNGTLDGLVRQFRPDLPHATANSKKRRQWRLWFVAGVQFERWKMANPSARCANCAEFEGEYDPPRCGLGYEKGGYYQPTAPDAVCMSWEEKK